MPPAPERTPLPTDARALPATEAETLAALGAGVTGLEAATVLVAGVFLGSAAWWLGLSGTVSAIRHALSDRTLVWINRIAAIAILSFGGWALLRAAQILQA